MSSRQVFFLTLVADGLDCQGAVGFMSDKSWQIVVDFAHDPGHTTRYMLTRHGSLKSIDRMDSAWNVLDAAGQAQITDDHDE
jgi:hypothetical protein